MASPTLTIHNEKESEFKFNLSIRGTDGSSPTVRFIIEDAGGYDVALNCQKTDDNRWLVKFPSLKLKEDSRDYRIEVITEGYYFCPVNGTLNIVHTPHVGFVEFAPVIQEKQRPEVSANLSSMIETVAEEKTKRLVEFHSMSVEDKKDFTKQCSLASKALIKVGTLLQTISESDKQANTVSSKGLSTLLETVQKSVQAVQGKIYL